MIPAAIGIIAAPKKKNSQVSRVNRSFSKVIERANEKIVAKKPKITVRDRALAIPLPL